MMLRRRTILNAGPVLISEQEISLGDAHIATKDGEAMFFHDSIDFSGYEGTDAGSTPYYLEFIDYSGLIAAAYAGAAGGGEVLGSELVTNGDMESGDPPDDWEAYGIVTLSSVADERTGGSGAASLEIARTGASGRARQKILDSSEFGKILKWSAWGKRITGYSFLELAPYADVADEARLSEVFASTSWFSQNGYHTPVSRDTLQVYITGDLIVHFDDVSAKFLTDVPATGLHLLSSKNGTTRNMASQESGFDPNNIAEIRVWRV